MAEKVGNAALGDELSPANLAENITAGLDVLDTGDEEFELDFGPKHGGVKTVTIGPMRMGQIRRFVKEAITLIPFLVAMYEHANKEGGLEFDVQELIQIDPEAFMRAISIASGLSVDELDDLFPDHFARVITKVLVSNMDFFAQRLPKEMAMAAKMVRTAYERLAATGRMPSTD